MCASFRAASLIDSSFPVHKSLLTKMNSSRKYSDHGATSEQQKHVLPHARQNEQFTKRGLYARRRTKPRLPGPDGQKMPKCTSKMPNSFKICQIAHQKNAKQAETGQWLSVLNYLDE